jgi:TPR repeat protein
MLASGSGVARDDGMALDWYKRASEKDNTLAMFNLAAMYDDGRAVKKNPVEAAALILRSLKLKNAAVYQAVAGNHRAWSRDFTIALQKALARDGFYRGKVDGAFGKPMLSAMQAAMK